MADEPATQEVERRDRLALEHHLESQARLRAERSRDEIARVVARWEERVRRVDRRAALAARVLAGDFDDRLEELLR